MRIHIGDFLTITIGEPKKHQLQKLIMVRHGESTGNSKEEDPNVVGDPYLRLTEKGRKQAELAGRIVGPDIFRKALVYASPYLRTRQTGHCALEGAGCPEVTIFEDPGLREVEHGYQNVAAQEEMRKIHGWFYYRFNGGESPADCYDRSSAFLETLSRQAERKNKDTAVLFTHGLTMRCIIARFLHLKVEEFEIMSNPKNAEIITIAPHNTLQNPVFKNGRWGVEGIPLRTEPR